MSREKKKHLKPFRINLIILNIQNEQVYYERFERMSSGFEQCHI